MKKTRFILGVIAAIAAAAMTGCQLELNNTEDRVSVGGYAVKSIEISGGTKSFVIDTAFTKGDLKVVAHSYDPAEAEAGVEVHCVGIGMDELSVKIAAVGVALYFYLYVIPFSIYEVKGLCVTNYCAAVCRSFFYA